MNKKTCTQCHAEKSIDEFNLKRGKPGPICRDCNKSNLREHYAANTEYYKKKAKDRLARGVALLTLTKGYYGCGLCSEDDASCLDFHHLDPSEKDIHPAEMARNGWAVERILEELKKCSILCCNCHRKLHAGKIPVERLALLKAVEAIPDIKSCPK